MDHSLNVNRELKVLTVSDTFGYFLGSFPKVCCFFFLHDKVLAKVETVRSKSALKE